MFTDEQFTVMREKGRELQATLHELQEEARDARASLANVTGLLSASAGKGGIWAVKSYVKVCEILLDRAKRAEKNGAIEFAKLITRLSTDFSKVVAPLCVMEETKNATKS